jgi:hypothetical protein
VRTGFWWGDLKERGHLEGVGVVGRIILNKVLKNRMECRGLGYSVPGSVEVAGTCECNNELSGYIECGEICSGQRPALIRPLPPFSALRDRVNPPAATECDTRDRSV